VGADSPWLPTSSLLNPVPTEEREISDEDRRFFPVFGTTQPKGSDSDASIRRKFVEDFSISEELQRDIYGFKREKKTTAKQTSNRDDEEEDDDAEQPQNKRMRKKAKAPLTSYKQTMEDMGVKDFDDWMSDNLKDEEALEGVDKEYDKEGNRLVHNAGHKEPSVVENGEEALHDAVDWVKKGQNDRLARGKPSNRRPDGRRKNYKHKKRQRPGQGRR